MYIIFVEDLDKELSLSYILELSYLKDHANQLVYLFITIYTENNINEKPVLSI